MHMGQGDNLCTRKSLLLYEKLNKEINYAYIEIKTKDSNP